MTSVLDCNFAEHILDLSVIHTPCQAVRLLQTVIFNGVFHPGNSKSYSYCLRVLCFCFTIILIAKMPKNVDKFKQKDVDKMMLAGSHNICTFVVLYILVKFNHNVA